MTPKPGEVYLVDLVVAGFARVPGGKGSHRKFRHPRFAGSVILSGKAGDDAQRAGRCSHRVEIQREFVEHPRRLSAHPAAPVRV